MKEIKKEKISYEIRYEAFDGTEFISPIECQRYENSATVVLINKLSDCTIARKVSSSMFDCNDENDYNVIVPKTEEDIDIINQLYFMWGGKDNLTPIVGKEDIGYPILMGYRIYDSEYDWVWFYIISKEIQKITNNMFTLMEIPK